MTVSAQVQYRGPEQSPLHPRLDLGGWVGIDKFFKGRNVSTVIFEPAQMLRKRPAHLPVLCQTMQLREAALTMLSHR